MRTFIADIIPKIQRFSQRIDDLTKLTNQHWVSVGEIDQTKKVFIFRTNNQLHISENRIVESGSWEYLGNQSLLINTKTNSYLLKHGFFDENIIALKLDSTDSYAFFVNETKYNNDLNNIQDVLKFLESKYLSEDKSKNKEFLNGKFSYTIINERKCFDIIWGKYTIYEIKFMNGVIGKVYKGWSTGNFFYLEYIFRKKYCKSFEDAVYNLFLSKTK